MEASTAMPTESQIEEDARNILRALAKRKNVILAGPPGTGKSRLLTRVANLFIWDNAQMGAAPGSPIPIPPATSPLPDWFPSPTETASRMVFPTVFDQNTKYRDFMRGLVPAVGRAGEFEVTSGTLYRAAKHALVPGNAALVIIDEINRGPAVAAFGSAIVGLEPDKRLNVQRQASDTSQSFEILGDQGQHQTLTLPGEVYILAAMNEADTSVEPLDVAFLRRFAPYRLEASQRVLREHLGLPAVASPLPAIPAASTDYLEGLVQAWSSINERILLGRGQPYQLGHGALMFRKPTAGSIAEVKPQHVV